MRIEFDYDLDSQGAVSGRHFIETDPAQPLGTLPPVGVNPAVTVISVIKGLHLGTIPLAGSGWDVVTKHPRYTGGMTRLQALLGEIVRLNDTAARTILGV